MEDAIVVDVYSMCLVGLSFMMMAHNLHKRLMDLHVSIQTSRANSVKTRKLRSRKLWRRLAVTNSIDTQRRLTLQQLTQLYWRQKRAALETQRLQLCLQFMAQRSSPSVWVQGRAGEWWTTVSSSFDDEEWIRNFRMSRETYEYICSRLKPVMGRIDTNYPSSVPIRKRVGVALWKLATNGEYRTVSHLFGVGISTACDWMGEFCSSVIKILLPEVIQMPNTEKLTELALYFERRWGLPECVGAIDGSHIPILAPQEYHTEYFNRKGWYSILLQAVVDGRGIFWNVNIGQPGSLHDASVLRLSGLWKLAEKKKLLSQQHKSIGGQNIGHYLLGDAAYPLTSWLMKPFPDNGRLTHQHVAFNHKISKASVVVENAFCQLKGRWRCLQKRNDCSFERVKSMVLTCCILHNLCESHCEEYREEWGIPAPFPQPGVRLQRSTQSEGVDVRAALMRHFNSVADH